ncbi:hypothetical protein HXX76_003067 [Chlamydomonas incerta]|uniref:Guanylate cyclase domain-containing protein n=1 Tax=Chlamydomonas incerta TaxID=51695 RepID=A0A835T9S1_CHLIN|nr:hypothetical protein HXX76_003067 [Chlamydomonas incerta]|eukprot:KAG2441444.1 hypothetical protein HXX76_003067 [Chlamydomonas incerta]
MLNATAQLVEGPVLPYELLQRWVDQSPDPAAILLLDCSTHAQQVPVQALLRSGDGPAAYYHTADARCHPFIDLGPLVAVEESDGEEQSGDGSGRRNTRSSTSSSSGSTGSGSGRARDELPAAHGATAGGRLHAKLLRRVQATYSGSDSVRLTARHVNGAVRALLDLDSAAEYQSLLAALVADDALLLAALRECCKAVLEGQPAPAAATAAAALAGGVISGGDGAPVLVVGHPPKGSAGAHASAVHAGTVHAPARVPLPVSLTPLIVVRPPKHYCAGAGALPPSSSAAPAPAPAVAVLVRYPLSGMGLGGLAQALQRGYAVLAQLPGMVTLLASAAAPAAVAALSQAASGPAGGLAAAGAGRPGLAEVGAAEPAWDAARGSGSVRHSGGRPGALLGVGEVLFQNAASMGYFGLRRSTGLLMAAAAGALVPGGGGVAGGGGGSRLLAELFELAPEGQLEDMLKQVAGGRTWRGIIPVRAQLSADVASLLESSTQQQQPQHSGRQPQAQAQQAQQRAQEGRAVAGEVPPLAAGQRQGSAAGIAGPGMPLPPLPQEGAAAADAAAGGGNGHAVAGAGRAVDGSGDSAFAGFSGAGQSFRRARIAPLPPPSGAVVIAVTGPAAEVESFNPAAEAEAARRGGHVNSGRAAAAGGPDSDSVPPLVLLHTAASAAQFSAEVAEVSDTEREVQGAAARERGSRTSASASVAGSAVGASGARARGFFGSLSGSRKGSLAGTSADAVAAGGAAGAPPPRRSYGGGGGGGAGSSAGWHARIWGRSRSSHSNRNARADAAAALGPPSVGHADSGGHAAPKRSTSAVGSEAQVESTSASVAGSAPTAGSLFTRLFSGAGAGAWLANSPQRAAAARPASATTAAPGSSGGRGGAAEAEQPNSHPYARLSNRQAAGALGVQASAASNTGGSGVSGNQQAALAAALGSGQQQLAGGPGGPLSATRPVTRRRIQFTSTTGPLASSGDATEAPLSTSTWGLLGTVRKMDHMNVSERPAASRSSVTAVTAAAAAAAVAAAAAAAASAQQANGTHGGLGSGAYAAAQLSGSVAANGAAGAAASSSRGGVARSRSDAAASGAAAAAAAAAIASQTGMNISDRSDQLLPLPASSSYVGSTAMGVGAGFESATGTDTHGTDTEEHAVSAGVARTGTGMQQASRPNSRSYLPSSSGLVAAGAGGGGGGGGGAPASVSGRVRSSLASREPSARFLSIVAAAGALGAAGGGAAAGVPASSRGSRAYSNRRASLTLSPAAAAAAAAAVTRPSATTLRARSCVGMMGLMGAHAPGSLAAAGGAAAAAAAAAATAGAYGGAAPQGHAGQAAPDRTSVVRLGPGGSSTGYAPSGRRGGSMEEPAFASGEQRSLLPPPPVMARGHRAASMPNNRGGGVGVLRLAEAAAAAAAAAADGTGGPHTHTRSSATASTSAASSARGPPAAQQAYHRLRASSQEWAQREEHSGAKAGPDADPCAGAAAEAADPADAMEAALARCRYVSDGGNEVALQAAELQQPQRAAERTIKPPTATPPRRSSSSRRRGSRSNSNLTPGRNVAGTQADDEADDMGAEEPAAPQLREAQPQPQQPVQAPRPARSRTPRTSSTNTGTAAATPAGAAAAAAAALGGGSSRANSDSSQHVLVVWSDRDTPGGTAASGQQHATSSDAVPQAVQGLAPPPRAGLGVPPGANGVRGGGGGGAAGALGLRPGSRAYVGPSLSTVHSRAASAAPGASGSGRGGARRGGASEGADDEQAAIEEDEGDDGDEEEGGRQGGGAGAAAAAPGAPGAAGAGAADAAGAGAGGAAVAAAAAAGCSWHEVTASALTDLTTGQPALLLVGVDVTTRVRAERQIAEVLDAEHRLLESIFPRHVLEVAAARQQQQLQREAAAAAGMGGRGGRVAGLGMAGLLLTADCASLATAHPLVTILFADIIGFTEMCHSVPSTAVMTFLNQLYSRLDTLLDVYGVYKVETIGDCYMVAGGLMTRDEEGFTVVRGPTEPVDSLHAHKAMAFAKAMLREAAQVLLPTTGRPVQMRIGLHSGPVMSGIVGSKMPRFCLFGDTVNTASRMESTCKPGAIHVSAATRQCLHSARVAAEDEEEEDEEEDEDGEWRPTGGVQVKGKGLMHTFIWRPRTLPVAAAAMAGGAGAALLGAHPHPHAGYHMPPAASRRSARASVPGGGHPGMGLGDTGDGGGLAGGGGGDGTISGAPHGAVAAVRRARRASAVTYCYSPGGNLYGGGMYRAGGGAGGMSAAGGMPYDMHDGLAGGGGGVAGGGLGSGGMRRAPRRSRASLRRSSLVLLGAHSVLSPPAAREPEAEAGGLEPTAALEAGTGADGPAPQQSPRQPAQQQRSRQTSGEQASVASATPQSPGRRPHQQQPQPQWGAQAGHPVPRRASSLQPLGFVRALQQQQHMDHLQYASRAGAAPPGATPQSGGGGLLLPARAASAVFPSGATQQQPPARSPTPGGAASAAAHMHGGPSGGGVLQLPAVAAPVAAARGAVRRTSSSSHLRPRRVRSFLAVKQPSGGAEVDLAAEAAAAAAATREAALAEAAAAAAGASGRLRPSGAGPAGSGVASGVGAGAVAGGSPSSTAHHSWAAAALTKSGAATATSEFVAVSGTVEPIEEEQGGV